MSSVVFAAGRPWAQLLKSVLDQLDPAAAVADLGLVFLADPATEMADLVLDGLRGRTGIQTWFGAASTAVFADGRELPPHGAIAVMPISLPGTRVQPFSGRLPAGLSGAAGGIIHLPDLADPAAAFASVAPDGVCPLVGGQSVSAFDHAQISMVPSAGSPSGVVLAGETRLVVGTSHGCQVLGPSRKVTAGRSSTILQLDGRPASDVLASEMGMLALRDPRALTRQVLAAGLAHDASGPPNLATLSTLYGIDFVNRSSGAIGLAGLPHGLPLPTRVAFYRRDPAAALRELADLAVELRRQLQGRPPKAALFYSSTERGTAFFGPGVDEVGVLAKALGPVPIIGMRSNAEVAGGHLTRYAAALALLA